MPPTSSITIEELTGRQRTLILVGPGLPRRGASWPIEQRLVTMWFPGNPEATQQVLGPIEAPSDWEGVWNTTRLFGAPQTLRESGSETQIVRAFTLHEQFEDIVRTGSLLRVTWVGDESRKIQREGRIGSYKPSWDRIDDVNWTATFTWIGRGGSTKKTVPQDENLIAAMRAAVQAMTDVQSAILGAPPEGLQLPDVPTDIPTLGVEDLEAIASAPGALLEDISNQISNSLGELSRTVEVIEQFQAFPDDFANQAIIAAKDTAATVKSISSRLSNTPSETYGAPGVGVGRTLRLVGKGIDVYRAAQNAEAKSLSIQLAARKVQTQPGRTTNQSGPSDLVTVHVVRSGETFASIAKRYYSDASLGAEIARANKFPLYSVTPPIGARLIIPAKVRSNSAA